MREIIGNEDGVATVYNWDEENGAFLSRHQDCSSILDLNHAFRVDGQRDDPVMGRKVASIPVVVYEEWCRLSGIRVQDFMRWPRKQKVEFLKRWMNDRDWCRVKTVEGRA